MQSPVVQPRVETSHLKMLSAVTGGPLLCLFPGFESPNHCLGCTTWPAGAHPAWRPGLTRSSGVQCCLEWLRRAQDRLPDLFSGTEHPKIRAFMSPLSGLIYWDPSKCCHVTLHRPCDKVPLSEENSQPLKFSQSKVISGQSHLCKGFCRTRILILELNLF